MMHCTSQVFEPSQSRIPIKRGRSGIGEIWTRSKLRPDPLPQLYIRSNFLQTSGVLGVRVVEEDVGNLEISLVTFAVSYLGLLNEIERFPRGDAPGFCRSSRLFVSILMKLFVDHPCSQSWHTSSRSGNQRYYETRASRSVSRYR